jgi:hypothetical protein
MARSIPTPRPRWSWAPAMKLTLVIEAIKGSDIVHQVIR